MDIVEGLKSKDLILESLKRFEEDDASKARYLLLFYILDDGSFGYSSAGIASQLEKAGIPDVLDSILADDDEE
jgi:hypothetical protein